jgi:hypothetical protein
MSGFLATHFSRILACGDRPDLFILNSFPSLTLGYSFLNFRNSGVGMRLSRSTRIGVVLLFLTCVWLVGCNSEAKRYRVTGTVTYKGEPVKAGSISFRSLDGAHAGGGAIANGEYDISESSGLVVGKYQVAINYPDPKGPSASAKEEMPGDSRAYAKDLLPAKYNQKTELTAEVKPEARNEINFDLK